MVAELDPLPLAWHDHVQLVRGPSRLVLKVGEPLDELDSEHPLWRHVPTVRPQRVKSPMAI